jgi:hypothetical protein
MNIWPFFHHHANKYDQPDCNPQNSNIQPDIIHAEMSYLPVFPSSRVNFAIKKYKPNRVP